MSATRRMSLLLLFRLVSSFAPPALGIGSVLFPVRGYVVEELSQSSNKRLDLAEVSDFFVDAFWTGKAGGGARKLSDRQRRELQQSQNAEFTKRYGGRRQDAEMLICKKDSDTVIACVGVEVDKIPSNSLKGPTEKRAPLMSNLAVSRKFRRRGLAEKMVEEVEKVVRFQWGYTECYLYVEERNRAARRLYEKLGYRKIWRDDTAKTLVPTESGDLRTCDTTIVCMKKNFGQNLFQQLFG